MRSLDRTETMTESDAVVRDRVGRLFRFVAALYERRNPVLRRIEAYDWTLPFAALPNHEALNVRTIGDDVEVGTDSSGGADGATAETTGAPLLRCKRPRRFARPAEPPVLSGLLDGEWDDASREPASIAARIVDAGEPHPAGDLNVRIARAEALARYRPLRRAWAEAERRTARTAEIFESLYRVYGMLERERETFELVVADGISLWRQPDGGIKHPLLVRAVRLEFDPAVPEFRIVESESRTEFASLLLRSVPDVDGRMLVRRRDEIEQLDPHPLDGTVVSGFLGSLVASLSPRGVYLGPVAAPPERDEPTIVRAPLFFLRRRTSGVAAAIEKSSRRPRRAPRSHARFAASSACATRRQAPRRRRRSPGRPRRRRTKRRASCSRNPRTPSKPRSCRRSTANAASSCRGRRVPERPTRSQTCSAISLRAARASSS